MGPGVFHHTEGLLVSEDAMLLAFERQYFLQSGESGFLPSRKEVPESRFSGTSTSSFVEVMNRLG